MKFTIKSPKKKIIIGSLVLSVILHLFVCKLPVDAHKKEVVVEVPANFVPVQIVSIAAPRIEEAKKAEQPKEAEKPAEEKAEKEIKKTEEVAKVKKPAKVETEINTKAVSRDSEYQFSENKPAAQKPKSMVRDIAPEKVNEVISKQNFTQAAQLTSNDAGNAASTIVPVIKNTNFTQTVAPEYPSRSVQLEQEGVVLIRALVSSTGEIEEITIHTSSGYQLLDESAKKAVSKWQFQAANINGNYTRTWVEVPVRFELKNN